MQKILYLNLFIVYNIGVWNKKQKEGKMAQKTIKKTKKTVAKKAASKPVAKKTVKKVSRPVAPVADVTMMAHECHCGCCCCRGHSFIKFCIKLVVLCMVFFLGCLSAPWFMQKADSGMMRHIKFDDNGCVMMEKVKCPKMLEKLSAADTNADGCISHTELKSSFEQMRGMHKHPRMERPEM